MTRYCERCERLTPNGNLWCPEKDCPAEAGYPILDYGDFLGDLKITRLARAWRTAALYEALRGETPVLVKVAHPGSDCADRLRRETHAFASIAPKDAKRKRGFIDGFFPKPPRPATLVPLAPYPVPSKNPYGEITFRGESKVYAVYQHITGKLLSDVLLENPQLWHYEVAWIITTIADALHPLVAKNKTHLGLHPDMILLDVDADGHWRPVVLDLGFLVEGEELRSIYDWPRLCEPAYTAPDLLVPQVRAAGLVHDVYSLGLMIYEMLAGRPGFEPKLLPDERLRRIVTSLRTTLAVDRPELEAAGVLKVVDKAIGATNRYASVGELGQALKGIYGAPPPEKRPFPRRFYVVLITLALILLIVACVAGYMLLQTVGR
jgi:serine/threonine protein kinase